MDDLRYPIGRFQETSTISAKRCLALVDELGALPNTMRAAVRGFSSEQLDTPYRPGGWTVRQVVHHVADAQMNWYARTKLALTEDEPLVRPYDERRWAETQEARTGPVEPSLLLIEGLYSRWTTLFRSLTPAEWSRAIRHPDRGVFVLDRTLPMHVWHGEHHVAHITALRKRMNW